MSCLCESEARSVGNEREFALAMKTRTFFAVATSATLFGLVANKDLSVSSFRFGMWQRVGCWWSSVV